MSHKPDILKLRLLNVNSSFGKPYLRCSIYGIEGVVLPDKKCKTWNLAIWKIFHVQAM